MIRFATPFGVGLGLAACVPTTAPDYLMAPANPTLRVRDSAYAPVTAGVKKFEVTGPKDWIEQNRQVGPQSGSGDIGQDSAAAARRGR